MSLEKDTEEKKEEDEEEEEGVEVAEVVAQIASMQLPDQINPAVVVEAA